MTTDRLENIYNITICDIQCIITIYYIHMHITYTVHHICYDIYKVHHIYCILHITTLCYISSGYTHYASHTIYNTWCITYSLQYVYIMSYMSYMWYTMHAFFYNLFIMSFSWCKISIYSFNKILSRQLGSGK